MTLADAVDGWYREVDQYLFDDPSSNDRLTRHFTQMVWQSTTAVGCAVNTACAQRTYVCRFNPAGEHTPCWPAGLLGCWHCWPAGLLLGCHCCHHTACTQATICSIGSSDHLITPATPLHRRQRPRLLQQQRDARRCRHPTSRPRPGLSRAGDPSPVPGGSATVTGCTRQPTHARPERSLAGGAGPHECLPRQVGVPPTLRLPLSLLPISASVTMVARSLLDRQAHMTLGSAHPAEACPINNQHACCRHGVAPLVWDESIAAQAAGYLAGCPSDHSRMQGFGENLAWCAALLQGAGRCCLTGEAACTPPEPQPSSQPHPRDATAGASPSLTLLWMPGTMRSLPMTSAAPAGAVARATSRSWCGRTPRAWAALWPVPARTAPPTSASMHRQVGACAGGLQSAGSRAGGACCAPAACATVLPLQRWCVGLHPAQQLLLAHSQEADAAGAWPTRPLQATT
jgi:hypothetical protein